MSSRLASIGSHGAAAMLAPVLGTISVNQAKDACRIAYEATQGSTSEELSVIRPVTEGHRIFPYRRKWNATLAGKLTPRQPAIKHLRCNTYVVPLDPGEFFVYVLPTQ
jgi:hypothetical protein